MTVHSLSAKPLNSQDPLRLTLTARTLRILSSLLFWALCCAVMGLASFWLSLPDVAELADTVTSRTITVRDWQGDEHPFVLGPDNPAWMPLAEMSESLPWAVIVAEDGAFYKHRGFDPDAIREALLYDLEQKRMARGASTITQQLAKNLYLTRDKTLARKLKELAIAWQMERQLSKERILELYLNLVELGPLVHGVRAGAEYHFGKSAVTLSAAEAAFLAAILPGPRVAYNPALKPEKVRNRAAMLLHFMLLRRVLSEEDYQAELASLERVYAPETETAGDTSEDLATSCAERSILLLPAQSVPAWYLPSS